MKRFIIMLAVAVFCFGFTATASAAPNLSEMISDANDQLGDMASDARDDISEFFEGTGDLSNGIIEDSDGEMGDVSDIPNISDSSAISIDSEISDSMEISELSNPPTSIPDTDTPSTGDYGVTLFALAALAAAVVALRVGKK